MNRTEDILHAVIPALSLISDAQQTRMDFPDGTFARGQHSDSSTTLVSTRTHEIYPETPDT